MKRISLGIVVAIAIASASVFCGLFMQKTFATPNYGINGSCSSDDYSFFPYALVCGGDPYDDTNLTVDSFLLPPAQSDGTYLTGSITRIGFHVHFHAHDKARTAPAPGGGDPGILLWSTVDINNDMFTGFDTISGGGDGTKACPGVTNDPIYGKPTYAVFNYKDDNNGPTSGSGGFPNGREASPAAYTGSSGYEDCQTEGRMVYWTMGGGPSGPHDIDENFYLNVNNYKSGDICVRANVSVSYGGPQWPTGPNTNGHEGNTAARVAKQSAPGNCIYIRNKPVYGKLSINDCSRYTISGAHDADHPGQGVFYRIAHTTNNAIIASGATDSSGYASGTANSFIPGDPYKLQVLDPDIVQWTDVPQGVISAGSNADPDCHSGLTAGCGSTTATDSGNWEISANHEPTYTHVEINGISAVSDYVGGLYPHTKTWKYVPNGRTVTVTATRYAFIANRWQVIIGYPQTTTYPCYDVEVNSACTVNSVTGDGPGGIVVAGHGYTANVTLTNTGQNDLLETYYLTGWRLGITGTGGDHVLGSGLAVGESGTITVSLTAPAAGPTTQTLSFKPVYTGGGFDLGNACAFDVPVYVPFGITPSAKLDPSIDWENPTAIKYLTGASAHTGPDLTVDQRAWLTVIPNGGSESGPLEGYHDTKPTYGPPAEDTWGPYKPTSIRAGDKYCAHVKINPATGYKGPSGDVKGGAPAEKSSCDSGGSNDTVTNEPYTHFLGADISAGGGFGTKCTPTKGGIYTYLKTVGVQPIGSGVQTGALSVDPVFGFSSAYLRGGPPNGSVDLTFANSKNTSGAPRDGRLGGELGLGGNDCITDYFAKMPEQTSKKPIKSSTYGGAPSNPSGNLNQVAEFYDVSSSGGTLTINANTIDRGLNLTIYVNGNVVITGNQTYASSSNYGGIANVPSLFIIAKGGNIYVDKEVKQLDGAYISQPNGGAGGTIYSCASGTTGYVATNTDLLSTCHRQLVVNGGFVANKVWLSRAYGSLRNSTARERLSPSIKACEDNISQSNTDKGDCAAEIFNFSPEIYLSQSSQDPLSGPSSGKFDYIASLPPVL